MKISKLLFAGILAIASGSAIAQPVASEMPINGKFYIQSAMNYGRDNGGYWDTPGSPLANDIKNGVNILVWDLADASNVDRVYKIAKSPETGYYEIVVGDFYTNKNCVVDVAGGNSKDGTNVDVWDSFGGANQRFLFHHLGNGRFKIYDKNGKIITLANRSSSNGSNVHIWGDHDGIWNEWYLIDKSTKQPFIPSATVGVGLADLKGDAVPIEQNFWIQSAMNYGRDFGGCWDVPGAGHEFRVGSNIQVWEVDGGKDRLYRFEKKRESEYYQIIGANTSDGVVDIAGGKTDNGTNVQIWSANGGSAQDFYLKHLGNGRYKIYNRSGKVVTLANRRNDNGSNVLLWDDHNGVWTEWYLVDPTTKKAFIPGQNKNVTKEPEMQSDIAEDNVSNVKNFIEANQTTAISDYLATISLDKLVKEDNGDAIVNAMNGLGSDDQANMCMYIMNGAAKNKSVDVRKHLYTKLANVSYKKPTFLVKALMNKHFSDFNESNPALKPLVSDIQNKITSAK